MNVNEKSDNELDSLQKINKKFTLPNAIIIILLTTIVSGTIGYISGTQAISNISTNAKKEISEIKKLTPTQPKYIQERYLWARGSIVEPCTSKNKNLGVTAIWKRYHNNKYKFSIEYPDTWAVNGSNIESIIFVNPSKNQRFFVQIDILDKSAYNPLWAEKYAPFYAATIFPRNDNTYILTTRISGPLDGGSDTNREQNIIYGPQILCGMLSTLRFED